MHPGGVPRDRARSNARWGRRDTRVAARRARGTHRGSTRATQGLAQLFSASLTAQRITCGTLHSRSAATVSSSASISGVIQSLIGTVNCGVLPELPLAFPRRVAMGRHYPMWHLVVNPEDGHGTRREGLVYRRAPCGGVTCPPCPPPLCQPASPLPSGCTNRQK